MIITFSSRRDRGMRHLNEFIDQSELTDLPLHGRKYTWCNAQESEKWSRIDRILLSPEWLTNFSMKLWGLPRLISDHCPLLMKEDDRDWGPKPFRFLNAWSLHPSFSQLFVSSWVNASFSGWSGYILVQKLKHLKLTLKAWNTEVFGNISLKLKALEEELHALDIVAEERALQNLEKARRNVVRSEIWKLYRMLEWSWHQKSRLNWTLHGDRNTRFFHVVASSRKSRNLINSITVNGVILEDPSRVKDEVLQHFKTQFSESWVRRPTLGGEFTTIAADLVSHHLTAEFSAAEILAAIKECNNNKAPGPDGFNLLCFQKFWMVMKQELVQEVMKQSKGIDNANPIK